MTIAEDARLPDSRAIAGSYSNPTLTVTRKGIVTDISGLSFSNQSGTTYTLALSDAGNYINFTSGSAVAVTVPTNASVAFPVGTQITLEQTGAGQITVAGAGGVTVNATPTLKSAAQFAVLLLIKKATDTWTLTGNLAAS